MQESDVKYLAGLYDADGSASLGFTAKGQAQMRLQIATSDAISPNHKILYWLQDTFGGQVRHHATLRASVVKVWAVQSRSEVNRLVPRLIKHLVIKGNSLAAQYSCWKALKGKILEPVEITYWKRYMKTCREGNNGPTKPKKHPTWAWVAGYIDGDGCLTNRYYAKSRSHHMRVSATAHAKDLVGMLLLQKAFGGTLYEKKTEPDIWVWSRNLGPREHSFAVRFLKKFVQHSKIKKHKAESILANHSQRLSERSPKG